MTRHGLWVAAWSVVLLSGCGQWGENEDNVDEDFPELSALTAVEQSSGTSVSDLAASAQVPSLTTDKLELKLKVGDHFPLIKSIVQTLTQAGSNGPITSRSEVSLLMAITVEEIDAGRKRLAVRYQRVRYSHDIAGEKVEYDSDAPAPAAVPEIVRAYQGLVNNGFSFWIGADNRVIDVVGFRDFLRRALRNIPLENQSPLLVKLAISDENQGIANFVDDSIGLLPYHSDHADKKETVQVGDTWTRKSKVFRPIPMTVTAQYTLATLNATEANIDVLGTITPSTITSYDSGSGLPGTQTLRIRNGHCTGHCTIDRSTGLPLFSRIERILDMVVQLADGSQIPQSKSIVTTIRAFPEQGTTTVSETHAKSLVIPTSGARAVDRNIGTASSFPLGNDRH